MTMNMYKKLMTNIILCSETLNAFTLKLETRQGVYFHSTGSPSQYKRQEKEIKGMEIEKEVLKLSLFAGNIRNCVENHKESKHTHKHTHTHS